MLFFAFAKAQTEQQKLEARKADIQRKINQYTNLLKNVKKEANTMVILVEALNNKITSTQEIITITNKEANTITRKIKTNSTKIERLEKDLKAQKKAYASMIVRAYKSKNEQSRLMFLLSSEDFLQAYKRVQYLKSYADYRKKQAQEIATNTEQLKNINAQLVLDKKQKQKILAANKKQQKALLKDKKEQENLLAIVHNDQKKFATEVRKAIKQRADIDKKLRQLIAADIAANNKGKTGAVKNKYFLSPEAKALANKFVSNKGKLPYPVDEFIITRRYGEQPHPVLPGIKVYCAGFRLQTPENSPVKSIFKGTVNRIEKARNGILTVHVRHGNYTSVYRNLKSVVVQKGDVVNTQDELGTVFTNKAGVTEMTFVLMEDTNNVNPAQWIMRL